jgi:hypothetical protein
MLRGMLIAVGTSSILSASRAVWYNRVGAVALSAFGADHRGEHRPAMTGGRCPPYARECP